MLLAFALGWSAAGKGYASAVIMSLHSLSLAAMPRKIRIIDLENKHQTMHQQDIPYIDHRVEVFTLIFH